MESKDWAVSPSQTESSSPDWGGRHRSTVLVVQRIRLRRLGGQLRYRLIVPVNVLTVILQIVDRGVEKKKPRIEPWGKPPLAGSQSDCTSPTLTVIVRFVRNVATSLRASVEAPFFAQDCKQYWKDIRLNALA